MCRSLAQRKQTRGSARLQRGLSTRTLCEVIEGDGKVLGRIIGKSRARMNSQQSRVESNLRQIR